jgi:hypothetical protein
MEESAVKQIADNHREVRGIQDDQEMMVAVAFTNPYEVRQLKCFHSVLHIDCTADTNKEGRPLLTITSKDSNGKMFTGLRCFMPNEQAWAFQWLFLTVFPALFGPHASFLPKLSVIVTDGDKTMIEQLEIAIARFFPPNVYRIRCSWHIIDRGWSTQVKLPLGGFSRRKRAAHLVGRKRKAHVPLTDAKRLARTFYFWMFSWAQPRYCLSREEYNVSKALFLYVLRTTDVTDILGEDATKTIISFARNFVFPHEEHFCYFLRKDKFHLDSHTNCGHEGTNNGLKHGAAPVQPQNRIDRAAQTLSFNADVKSVETKILMEQKLSTKSLWSNSPTSNSVTDICESMLMFEWNEGCSRRKVFRTSHHRWIVIHENSLDESPTQETDEEDEWKDWCDDESENSEASDMEKNQIPHLSTSPTNNDRKSFIPRFRRAYDVNVCSSDNVFVCSCNLQKSMGIPCRHISSVVHSEPSLLKTYPNGFPLNSVSVFWYAVYYRYGVSNSPKYQAIRDVLKQLMANDTKGLRCPDDLESLELYQSSEEVIAALELLSSHAAIRVANYKLHQVHSATGYNTDRNLPSRYAANSIPAGLSQASHLPDDSDEWPDFSINDHYEDEDEFDRAGKSVAQEFRSLFFECADAIARSENVAELKHKWHNSLQQILVEARSSVNTGDIPKGSRVSMIPANSRRTKTHGTNY